MWHFNYYGKAIYWTFDKATFLHCIIHIKGHILFYRKGSKIQNSSVKNVHMDCFYMYILLSMMKHRSILVKKETKTKFSITSIITVLVYILLRDQLKDIYGCGSFSLHWRPINGIWLLSALWSGCCRFDTFPISILSQFYIIIELAQTEPK